ncbi:hypothetical protein V866_004282 [Kwoniella sp. B9012]
MSSKSPAQPTRPSTLPLIPQQPHWTRPPPSPPSHTPLTSSFPRDATLALSSLSISQQPIPLPTPSPGPLGSTQTSTKNGNTLSPPTPAPSPSPRDRRAFRQDESSDEEMVEQMWKGKGKGQQSDVRDPQGLLHSFTTLSPSQRFTFLNSLIGELRLNEALVVSRKIEPLLRRDFLRELPAELALHCLSFVDEPRTLARAAQVSNYWNQLLQDEQTWKDLFDRHNFPNPPPPTSFVNSNRPSIGIRRRSTQTSGSFPTTSTIKNSSMVAVAVAQTPDGSQSQSYIKRATPFGFERRVLNLASSSTTLASRSKEKENGTFKNRFKNAYLTESNWLSGGRKLANHISTDDAVVTTLCFDDSHIVVGMANNKIHVFDAVTGAYLRSLLGHRQGVWAMVLVSASPNGEESDEDESQDLLGGSGNNNNTTYSWTKASDSYRDNGQSRRSSFAGGPTTERHPPLSTSSSSGSFGFGLNSNLPGGIFANNQISDYQSQPIRPNTAMGFSSTNSSSHNNYTGLKGLGIGGNDHNSYSNAESSTYKEEGGEGRKQRSSDPCGCARGWKGNKNNLVVSAGCDKEVKVWNLDTGELIHSMRGHRSTIRCLKVLDRRPVAISGSRDHTLRVWDIENGFLLHVLEGHEESVRCVEIAGNKAVSGSYDYTSKIWDLDTGECLHTLRGHYHQIYSVAFDGQTVITGSLDSTIRVWSGATGECLALLQGHTALVGQLQLSSNRLITGGSDGRVIIFDLNNLSTLHRLCAHDNSVTCLQFNDKFIVSGGNDGRVKLWDVKSGRFIRELTRPCDAVWRIGFRSDRVVLLCQREGRTCLEVISFRPGEGESSRSR